MKIAFIALALSLASTAFSADLKNCVLTKNGQRVKEIKKFNINKFDTEEPVANIDGGLLDFQKNKNSTKMAFSNECDNIYDIEFSNKAIELAKAGVFKKLIGKAEIGTADMESPIKGIISCDVKN
ncbi:MAG: hypothetical protein WC635_05010 [Bacteriovorax sp.]|jgi:hypothetical protein